MPNKQNHWVQYKKNKTLSNSKILKQPEYRDWRIVTIFYAALHCIESSYADRIHNMNHYDRKQWLCKLSGYDKIIDDYDNLEMLSKKSRYQCVKIGDNEVKDALVNLHTIEQFVKKISS